MTADFADAFDRYLAAKRSVDDRALNRVVWDALEQEIEADASPSVSVLELGAGIGTMIERTAEWHLFGEKNVDYVAIDSREDNIQAMQARLAASPLPYSVRPEAVTLQQAVVRAEWQGSFDLIIAHAFLDLIDLPTMLPAAARLLRPGGLLYATINFDGITAFEPAVDPNLDRQIEDLYHATMDNRIIDGKPSGDSKTGRHLFSHLRNVGMEIVEAGSSDWIVFPRDDGNYRADERYFLGYILGFVEGALTENPALDAAAFSSWIQARRDQLERGDLIYMAHQLDLLARRPAGR